MAVVSLLRVVGDKAMAALNVYIVLDNGRMKM